MSKMYQGYKVMDEMVSDAIYEFAKAYFENFNTYIDLELKSLRMLHENQTEIHNIQMGAFNDLVHFGNVQSENLDKIINNQRELNDKFDILIEQNERIIDLLSSNSQADSDVQNICPECGNAIPVNSKFCIKCGAKF